MSIAAVGPATRVGGHISVERHFTASEHDPYAEVKFERRTAKIANPDGSVVFQMDDVEIPVAWSKVAGDILVSKYFRKGGVPQSVVDGLANLNGGKPVATGSERSVRQVIDRIANAIANAGRSQGYLVSDEDVRALRDELRYILVRQFVAFNSPVWFNLGLHESYGIKGDPAGNWAVDLKTGVASETLDGFSRPQVSACFIRTVKDDLTQIGLGIAEEMRIFKYGSGAGANFSTLRAKNEKLSGGGSSSGLMSFLKVYDAAAGSVKSGGTTRRAAKLVCLDADHPDIEEFIEWKAREEDKVAVLVKAGYSPDFNGEAYATVSGQNANNSVRVTDDFMHAVLNDGDWQTKYRTTGKVAKTLKAKKLMRKIAEAAHRCADPGMMFDTTINRWNTVPDFARIDAANPCNEFHFVNDSACNLSSINLVKFLLPDGTFDIAGFEHVCRVLILAMDILVDHASYPTKAFAENSHQLRPLGLGYANLGALLMRLGVSYDSDEGRGICASITSLMAATAWDRSAEIASVRGSFSAFERNRAHMLNVARMHAAEGKKSKPSRFDIHIAAAAKGSWESAITAGEMWGYRNAQLTLLAPTGTIGLLMDCDTTGIEPDFALVKNKAMAGGGAMKLVNQSVGPALERLGYAPSERLLLEAHIAAHETIEGSGTLKREHLPVFDCATQCGERGQRFIAPMAHVKMMAAAQPFLCGAISKTVNMPESATVDEIEQVYIESWKLGVKALAVYRDGSKGCQVLTSKKEKTKAIAIDLRPTPAPGSTAPILAPPLLSERKRLPKRRRGFTQEATISGQKVYVRTGEYDDGKIGELFIDMAKAGSTIQGLLDTVAILTSLGLQHGVPLDEYVEAFTFTKFEPSGPVQGDARIKSSFSVIDYIFRTLAVTYLNRDDLAHKPAPVDEAKPKTDRYELPVGLAAKNGDHAPANTVANVLDLAANDTVRENLRQLLAEKPGARLSLSADQPCGVCGNPTIRAATCAFCLTCGATTGCG